MKFSPGPFDGADVLILLVAVGTLALIGAMLAVSDVERFLAAGLGDAGGDLIATSESSPSDLSTSSDLGLAGMLGGESEPVDIDRRRGSGSRALLCALDTRDVALHEGLIWFATGGGLIACRPDGGFSAHYSHLNGLPDDSLRSFAEWRGALWIGSDSGLVRLRDGVVTTFSPGIGEGEKITALLPDGERLLVGTDGAGLLSFDGSRFSRDAGRLPGADFRRVTALAHWRGQLVVGSREMGLFILRGASFTRLGKDKGLPSDQVSDLAPGDELLVATVTGLCTVDDALVVRPWSRGAMAAAVAVTPGATLVGTLDGRLESYTAGRRRQANALGDRSRPVLINRIASVDNRTWVLTSEGPFVAEADGLEPFGERPPDELAAAFVAALDFDSAGRLWIGYFDSGVEVLAPDLRKLRRIDDEAVRTVKCIRYDSLDDVVHVGSSKGLTAFRPDGTRDSWTADDGLINNEVNHVLRWGDDIVAATGGGISFIRGREVRSIYAFHGLVNNRVFCLQPIGGRLAAGTLGGISILEGNAVAGRLTPENSGLPTHWITALAELDSALLVGTYGGGVAVLRPDGSWDEMPRELRSLEINPNAVLVLEDLVLFGTLDRGLVVLDRRNGEWKFWSRGLGSANVTALAAGERRLIVGTDRGIMIVDSAKLK